MESLVELFCHVDDFCKEFLPTMDKKVIGNGLQTRKRDRSLTMSEILTILILSHQSHYRNFKAYYLEHVFAHLHSEFPGLVSYTRFVDFIPTALIPLCAYFKTTCLGDCTGISFIDSTSLDVCLNQRILSHKVFAGLAERGKTSTGWFFGFKLHLVINDRGELLNVTLTPANVDDRKPVPSLVHKLFGKAFGDKDYISKSLVDLLRQTLGMQFITKLKANAKNRLPMEWINRILIRKRAIVESVIDQLNDISQIEHSRHRSVANFLVNLMSGLIAYAHQPKKPSLGLDACLGLPA